MLRGFLADHDHILGVAYILIREVTTADDRNTHCGEITGSDCTVDAIRRLARRRGGYGFFITLALITLCVGGRVAGAASCLGPGSSRAPRIRSAKDAARPLRSGYFTSERFTFIVRR